MTILELARDLNEGTHDPRLGHWSYVFQERLAQEIVGLGAHLKRMNEPERERYWEVVKDVLSSIEDTIRVRTAESTFHELLQSAPDEETRGLIRNRTYVVSP